jgi:hypothetical protein
MAKITSFEGIIIGKFVRAKIDYVLFTQKDEKVRDIEVGDRAKITDLLFNRLKELTHIEVTFDDRIWFSDNQKSYFTPSEFRKIYSKNAQKEVKGYTDE